MSFDKEMSFDKVVVRAVTSTLCSIGILFVFLTTMLVCLFPSMLMNTAYKLGMDSVSIVFAESAYNRSHEVYYIDFAVRRAIELGSDEKIAEYGERFIADEQFDAYCAACNEQAPAEAEGTYEHAVYAAVCVAEYNLGEKTTALELAFDSVGNAFPRSNAVGMLIVVAVKNADTAMMEIIEERINTVQVETLSEGDAAYLGEMLALLNE